MPKRIQLRRTKGWRKPPNTVVVARPSKWGNPFVLGCESRGLVHYGPKHLERFGREWDYEGRISSDGNRHDMWFSRDDIIETHVRYAQRTPGPIAASRCSRSAWRGSGCRLNKRNPSASTSAPTPLATSAAGRSRAWRHSYEP